MLLTFLGRNSEEMMMHGDVSTLFELVAKSLQSLVLKVLKYMLGFALFASNDYAMLLFTNKLIVAYVT